MASSVQVGRRPATTAAESARYAPTTSATYSQCAAARPACTENVFAPASVLADVAPLVAVQDRGDEEANGYARGDRAQIETPAHRVIRADDHERPHQQENKWDADRPELVLEWRRGIGVAADEPDDAERDDRPAAHAHQVQADEHRDEKCRDREPIRGAAGDASFHDCVARARRYDRVDALAHVVDLVGDVRADVERDAAHERGEEEDRIECGLDRGEGAARPERE